jgi:two-component system, LytTR family, response regulator LytT
MLTGKLKILLVEDDPMIYMRLKKNLEKAGYSVLQHASKPIIDNYEDMVQATKVTIPHLAVLDISIAGDRDGLEVGQYIREQFHSPIIFLSNQIQDETLRRYNLLNADGFIVKVGKSLAITQLVTSIKLLHEKAEDADRIRRQSGVYYVRPDADIVETDISFNSRYVRMQWAELDRIEVSSKHPNTVVFHLSNKKRYLMANSSLVDVLNSLPSDQYFRVNKWLVIAARLIHEFGKSLYVFFIDDVRMEVTEAYREAAEPILLKRRN